MLNTIVGSKYVGSFIKKSDTDVLTILGALDNLNDPSRQMKVRGMEDLYPFVKRMEGLNGKQEAFKNYKIRGVEDGYVISCVA